MNNGNKLKFNNINKKKKYFLSKIDKLHLQEGKKDVVLPHQKKDYLHINSLFLKRN